MKDRKLLSALSHVDPKLVEEAADATAPKRKAVGRVLKHAFVACQILVVGALLFSFAQKYTDKGGYNSFDPQPTTGITDTLPTDPIPTGTAESTTGQPIPTEDAEPPESTTSMKVAMISCSGFFSDGGYNQTVYEACQLWCDNNGAELGYFKPTEESTEARIASIELAIEEGNQLIILPREIFADAIVEIAEVNPDVFFLGLDVDEEDLQTAADIHDIQNYICPPNVLCVDFREEIAGFLAGAYAVRTGYTKLGFLGSVEIPEVTRYGYGFLQGADYAAGRIGADVQIKFHYANQLESDENLTAFVDTWYREGTEVVFACGGNIHNSVAEAASNAGAKMIGADFDQSYAIDNLYGEGIVLTSAIKSLSTIVEYYLDRYYGGSSDLGGWVLHLGAEFLGLPETPVGLSESTQWSESFTEQDYYALTVELDHGGIFVSDDSDPDVFPVVEHITIDDGTPDTPPVEQPTESYEGQGSGK
ncbi:MAG: BMP family ABC transporter substrate-binding protein [Oscillospiraceae bacterium]|nr:BMP family ABC transporter substrate-binding protein [Oscillospiraceae bacterium]